MAVKIQAAKGEREAELAYEQELLLGGVVDVLEAVLSSLGISQRELAERLGVTEGRVSQILSGARSLNLSTLAAVGLATGVRFEVVPLPIENELEPAALDQFAWMKSLRQVVAGPQQETQNLRRGGAGAW